ncbi:uncharacterized protein LOC106875375 [Octopus bimaculoides]|uniref:uncharacterized protein LOC106875375 n=1 Tax=Octopus bimaculoides TaxID=37653 RepID=UPI0022E24C06|nr:uncharacterized protein LOC106875375 [Octopus bimaculoides]
MGQAGHKQKQNSAENGRYSKNKKVRDSYESSSSVRYNGNEPCLPSFSMKNAEKACNLSFQELEMMDNRNLAMEHNTAQNKYDMDQICVDRMPNMYPVEPGENHSYGGPVGQEIWYTEVDFNPHYTNRSSYNNQGFEMEPGDPIGTSNNVRVQFNIPNMPEVQSNPNESTENMDVHYQNNNTVEGDMSEDNGIILPYNTLYSQVEIHPKPSDFECNSSGEQCYYQCVNTEDEISSDEKNKTVSFVESAYTDTAKTTEPLFDIQRNLMESVVGNRVDISAIDVIETRHSPSCSYDEDGQSIEEIDTNTDVKDETAGTSSSSSVVHRMVARTVKKISLLSDLIRQWKCNAKEKDCFDELQVSTNCYRLPGKMLLLLLFLLLLLIIDKH